MDQEAILLQKIDRLKIAAADENREKAIFQLLEKVNYYCLGITINQLTGIIEKNIDGIT
jgi:hypothetical protein